MDEASNPKKQKSSLNISLLIVVGLVGVLTLVILLGAVLGGIWLDNTYNTKPTFTIILIIASIPVSLVVMFVVVRSAAKRITAQLKSEPSKPKEEVADLGREKDA